MLLQFSAKGLTRKDWEQFRPQLEERGYRLFSLRDWPERVEGLREDGQVVDEARLNKIVHTVGSVGYVFASGPFTIATTRHGSAERAATLSVEDMLIDWLLIVYISSRTPLSSKLFGLATMNASFSRLS